MTGMVSSGYRNAPIILAYSDPEMIKDQSQIATLIIPSRYNVTLNRVLIKEKGGKFNPDLRKSKSANMDAYIIDVIPGAHELEVTYNAMQNTDGSNPSSGPMNMQRISSNMSVGASVSAPSLFKWNRDSKTSHTLEAGKIYVLGLKAFTPSGEIDLYPLDESDRHIVIETRDKAEF